MVRRTMRGFWRGVALLSIAWNGPVTALEQARPSNPAPEWALLVSPYAWGASLKGKGSLAGISTSIDVPFSDILDELDLAVMGNAEVTNGRFGFYLDGQYVETSQSKHLLAHRISLGVATTRLSAGAFFKLYETELGGTTVFGRPRTLSFEPTAGVRWTRLSGHVGLAGLGFGKASGWYDPFVGLRINADLTDRWNLLAEADAGGTGTSQYSFHAQAYLGYRTLLLGRETTLRAGYRAIYQNYTADDFTGRNRFRWDVTQHGPAVGLTMRF